MDNITGNLHISNEHLFIMEILNSMYNDNVRQIDNLTGVIDRLNQYNNNIRELLFRITTNNIFNSQNQQQNQTYTQTNNTNNTTRRTYENSLNISNLSRNNNTTSSSLLFNIMRRLFNNTSQINYTNDEYTNIYEFLLTPLNEGSVAENNELLLTEEQIQYSTYRVTFKDITSPQNMTCPITMEDFTDEEEVMVITICRHIFKPTALNAWLTRSSRCPVCRRNINLYYRNNVV